MGKVTYKGLVLDDDPVYDEPWTITVGVTPRRGSFADRLGKLFGLAPEQIAQVSASIARAGRCTDA